MLCCVYYSFSEPYIYIVINFCKINQVNDGVIDIYNYCIPLFSACAARRRLIMANANKCEHPMKPNVDNNN